MKARKVIVFAVAAALAVSCGSCVSEKKLAKKGLYNCSERLTVAVQRVEKKNYANAVRILEEVKYQCGGSSLMDSVYYYAAFANFKLKQYVEARDEFEALYREFPRSPFVDEALYRVAHMRYLQSSVYYRDQTETKEALRLFGDYLDIFPNGAFADSAKALHKTAVDKLAEKEFATAQFYRKQKEHEAALIYYRALLSEYPESKFAPEAVVGMAEMLVLLGRTQDASEVMEELDSSAFDEKLKVRIDAVKQKLSADNSNG